MEFSSSVMLASTLSPGVSVSSSGWAPSSKYAKLASTEGKNGRLIIFPHWCTHHDRVRIRSRSGSPSPATIGHGGEYGEDEWVWGSEKTRLWIGSTPTPQLEILPVADEAEAAAVMLIIARRAWPARSASWFRQRKCDHVPPARGRCTGETKCTNAADQVYRKNVRSKWYHGSVAKETTTRVRRSWAR